jgi:hypothetical protein
VLNDWNMGRIQYFTVPPAVSIETTMSDATNSKDQSTNLAVEGDAIVHELAPEFDLDKLFGEADNEALGGLKSAKEMSGLVKAASSSGAGEEGNVKLFGEDNVRAEER